MPKKIYDIKPPKVKNKLENSVVVKVKSRSAGALRTSHNRKKKTNNFFKWQIPVAILVLIIIIGTYLFFKLPKADITIWPKIDTLSFKQTITADKSVDSVDIVKAVIPAQYFQATKTNSQDFPATGNALDEGKASGTITIYNKYDPPMPFTFKAGTHFMSDSGKLFIAPQKIIIPPAKKIGSKVTPGSVQVKVQAVEGGSDYNIAPSNFSVPGLKGTSYYYSINATSTNAMTGGYSGKVKKVTADDIQGAKDILSKKTTSDAIADLRSKISSDYVLLENAILSEITNASTQTKSGTTAENFNYQVTVMANTLVFKKSDLDQFAKNYIISQIPEGKTLLDNSFKINYSASIIDVSGGKATLNLNFSSGVYQNIDKNSISLSLLGENEDQIKATINSNLGDQVSNMKIKFWPFWVSSAPNNQNKIKIELKFQ